MLKISGGIYRSRIIEVPPEGTVPTKNMVREAVFNAIRDIVPGARALDLFAGSGALGIEALSHGAKAATFVDLNSKAADVIRGNLAKLKEENGLVLVQNYGTFLASCQPNSFDIVFLDPPYIMKEVYREVPTLLVKKNILSPTGVVVLEYEGEAEIPLSLYGASRLYNYGRSKVCILWRSKK